MKQIETRHRTKKELLSEQSLDQQIGTGQIEGGYQNHKGGADRGVMTPP